jgi:hypothetical protein
MRYSARQLRFIESHTSDVLNAASTIIGHNPDRLAALAHALKILAEVRHAAKTLCDSGANSAARAAAEDRLLSLFKQERVIPTLDDILYVPD